MFDLWFSDHIRLTSPLFVNEETLQMYALLKQCIKKQRIRWEG